MSSSFISVKGKDVGFWTRDGVMQIVCIYLLQAVGNSQKNSWPVEFLELLDSNAQGLFPGWMHFDFHKHLNSDEKRQQFLQLIEEAKQILKLKGRFISEVEIDSYFTNKYLQNKWNGPVETSTFMRALDFLEALIQDKITTTSNDPIDYW